MTTPQEDTMPGTECAIDFSTPIRSGTGKGVLPDGTVDACLVQRSYLRAWCHEHPDSPLADIVGKDIPDGEPTVSPVLRAFAVALNDGLPDDERQRLAPYEERLLGTRGSAAIESQRAWMATDWLVRSFTPTWLRKCGLGDRADQLASLPELTGSALAKAAQPIIERARAEADAARDEKGYDAQYRAARAAADKAIADVLGETIVELRGQAFVLFDRMIDVHPVPVAA